MFSELGGSPWSVDLKGRAWRFTADDGGSIDRMASTLRGVLRMVIVYVFGYVLFMRLASERKTGMCPCAMKGSMSMCFFFDSPPWLAMAAAAAAEEEEERWKISEI